MQALAGPLCGQKIFKVSPWTRASCPTRDINVDETSSILISWPWQALAQAAAGQLESHSRDWVPLLLAFSAAKASGESAAAGAGHSTEQQPNGTAAAEDAAAANSEAESEADEAAQDAAAGEAADAAERLAGPAAASGGLASHVGGRAWRAHLKVSMCGRAETLELRNCLLTFQQPAFRPTACAATQGASLAFRCMPIP